MAIFKRTKQKQKQKIPRTDIATLGVIQSQLILLQHQYDNISFLYKAKKLLPKNSFNKFFFLKGLTCNQYCINGDASSIKI